MRRTPERVVAALAVVALLVWCAALVTSTPPPAPTVALQADGAVVEGAPWAVRVVAVAPGGRAPLAVGGRLRIAPDGPRTEAPATADVVDGVARFDAVHFGGASSRPVVVELDVQGVAVEGALRIARRSAVVPPVTRWSPWYAEVALRTRATAPVYPVDGRVSARLPSRVLVLDGAVPEVVTLAPRVEGARLDDGRLLQLDRSGMRVTARAREDAASPADRVVDVDVERAEAGVVSCDLVVDGAVHDVVTRRVPAGVTQLSLRGSFGDGALVVAHCGGPFTDATGRAVVVATAPGAERVRALARAAAAPPDEPLLALPDDVLAQPDVARAALARVVPAVVRAPVLDVAWTVARGPGALLRALYGALAFVVVFAALVVGLARAPARRGAVVLGALALAGVLGGLFGVLAVLAR